MKNKIFTKAVKYFINLPPINQNPTIMLSNWFETSTTAIFATIIHAVLVYIGIILFTRLMGKRSFSKMSGFDFAGTIAIGSLIATTITSKSVGILQGLIALLSLYTLQFVIASLRRFPSFSKAVDNEPLYLMKGTEILHENLKKAQVSENDLRGKLREANVIRLNQVKAVIFETTGDVSVLHSDDTSIEIEDFIVYDVEEK